MKAVRSILREMQTALTRVRVVIAARTEMRRTFRDALAAAGMQVAADCSNAADLLAAVSRERPDVCVLDRELRGGGLAATAAIAAPRQAPKVLVVVGGRGSAAELRAARLVGAAGYVHADIEAADLAAAVSALVRKEQS